MANEEGGNMIDQYIEMREKQMGGYDSLTIKSLVEQERTLGDMDKIKHRKLILIEILRRAKEIKMLEQELEGEQQ